MKIDVRSLINKYGNQIILEELISHTEESITAAKGLDAEEKYLGELLINLKVTLNSYMSRYNDRKL